MVRAVYGIVVNDDNKKYLPILHIRSLHYAEIITW